MQFPFLDGEHGEHGEQTHAHIGFLPFGYGEQTVNYGEPFVPLSASLGFTVHHLVNMVNGW